MEFHFDNTFINTLPEDENQDNTCRQVFNACYSMVQPQKVPRPQQIIYSPEVAQLLDLDDKHCKSLLFEQVFSGNQLLPGMQPHATCYGGHQFGQWAGQLGDGRAINLGEAINSKKSVGCYSSRGQVKPLIHAIPTV